MPHVPICLCLWNKVYVIWIMARRVPLTLTSSPLFLVHGTLPTTNLLGLSHQSRSFFWSHFLSEVFPHHILLNPMHTPSISPPFSVFCLCFISSTESINIWCTKVIFLLSISPIETKIYRNLEQCLAYSRCLVNDECRG